MATIKSILKPDRLKLSVAGPDILVVQALEQMAEHDLGALLVFKDGEILGVFSERDYARKVILEDKSSRTITISEVMTTNVFFVLPTTSLEECLALMAEKRVRHLPVIDEINQLVDFVTMRDIVAGIVSDKEYMIEQLNCYITGSSMRVPNKDSLVKVI